MSYKHIPPETKQKICIEGGKAAHRAGTCHEFKPGEEARENGRIGGLKTSSDRAWMRELARRSNEAQRAKREARRGTDDPK